MAIDFLEKYKEYEYRIFSNNSRDKTYRFPNWYYIRVEETPYSKTLTVEVQVLNTDYYELLSFTEVSNKLDRKKQEKEVLLIFENTINR